jgi:hypothetical protein
MHDSSRLCNKSNTTAATSEGRNCSTFRSTEFSSVVSVSALTWIIIYIYYWNVQNIYYNNKSILKYILVYHIKHVVCLCVWHECKIPGIWIIYWHCIIVFVFILRGPQGRLTFCKRHTTCFIWYTKIYMYLKMLLLL